MISISWNRPIALVLFLACGTTVSAQSDRCRGTSATISPPSLKCTGTCGGNDQCRDRAGTGTYKGWTVCNCSTSEAPNSCCGLALSPVSGGGLEVRRVGDCLGCGYPDRVCVKIVSGGEFQALCLPYTPGGH